MKIPDGYKIIQEVGISKLHANLLGVLIGAVLLIFTIFSVRSLPWETEDLHIGLFGKLAFFVALITFHESLHAYAALKWAKVHSQDIKFDFNWRALMPSCHVAVPISVRNYRVFALLPLWVTGSFSFLLLVVFPCDSTAIIFTMSCAVSAGDLLMFKALGAIQHDKWILDIPSEPAFYVLADTKIANQSVESIPSKAPR